MTLAAAISQDPFIRKWPVLVRVMLGRLVLLVGLLAGLSALMAREAIGSYAALGFYLVVAVAFVVTILYAQWLRRDDTVQQSAPNQFVVDVLVITGLVHFTGGIDSDLALLYPLVILAAGIVVSGRLALRIALLAVFVYATLVVLEMGGILAYPSARAQLAPPETVVQKLMIRALIFVFFAAGSSYLSDRVFYQGRQLERLATIGQALFNHVTVPLLGVHPDGRVILINPPAAALLGLPAEQIRGRWTLADLFVEQEAMTAVTCAAAPGESLVIWHMRRADGSAFPVTFNASRAHLPAAVSDSLIEAPGDVELHVIAFRDVTGILAAQTHARVRATAGVLTEVAHTMGNPLAAIKCAGEVLTQAMAASTKEEERKITPADWTMISSMCDVIAEETARLDEKMKEFLERAGGDPEKLLELTAEAEDWSARLRMCPGGRSHGQDSPDR